jgi:hypothetical protein
MSTLTVAGFGDSGVNGVYTSVGTHSDETLYRKGSTGYWLRYEEKWYPWSGSENYYIVKTTDISTTNTGNSNVVPLESPRYRIPGNVASSVTESWVALMGNYTGEATTGTVS